MIDSPLAPDLEELERLSMILTNITSDSRDQKYSTVLSTGKEQLFLVKDGNPILRFGIAVNDEDLAFQNGMKLVDNLMSNLENLRHFVLLYDHAALARKIEFQFMKIGLQRGESCVYVTTEDDVESPESIKGQMDAFGINTAEYLAGDRLRLLRIRDPTRDPEGFFSDCQKIVGSLPLDRTKPPGRVVCHMKYQMNVKQEIDLHSGYEKMFQLGSVSFHGSLLCNHYIGKYDSESHGDWLKNIFQTHGVSLVICSEKTRSVLFPNNFFVPSASNGLTKSEAEFGEFEPEIQELSDGALERDISELKNDIEFLISQVRVDLESYSPNDLQHAVAKISYHKRKEEKLRSEHARRINGS
ncbi:MAG: RAD55 family ATPase [Nitrososphaerales archaeon]